MGKMKITKKQLRNIIKEEIRPVLHVNESGSYYSKDKPYFPWDEFANSIAVAEFYFTGQGWSERDISDIHPDGHEHVHNFMKRPVFLPAFILTIIQIDYLEIVSV